MKKILLFIIISSSLFNTHTLFSDENVQNNLAEAYQSYLAGEKAKTIAERKAAFNKALSAYAELEKQYDVSLGDGKLQYNLANSYFQVEEYPWAVLYYYKANALLPREERVQRNLNIALAKLGLEPMENRYSWQDYFTLRFLSLPERLQLFLALSLVVFGLLSYWLFKPTRLIRNLLIVFGIALAYVIGNLAYSRYLEPVEGVLVHSTMLYRDAGEQFATVTDQPIISGNKVQVLGVLQNGQWLKILSPNGEIGYIPQRAIRLI